MNLRVGEQNYIILYRGNTNGLLRNQSPKTYLIRDIRMYGDLATENYSFRLADHNGNQIPGTRDIPAFEVLACPRGCGRRNMRIRKEYCLECERGL